MTDLKPCPFCGGEAELVSNDIGVFVGCFHENCPIGPQTSTYLDGYATEAAAIAAWNARVGSHCAFAQPTDLTDGCALLTERTCRDASLDKSTQFYCSVCECTVGIPLLWGDLKYCPGCGARVERGDA